MEIIRTNIEENDYSIDVFYDMFESEDRAPMKDAAGKTVEVERYAIYEDENGRGETVSLVAIQEHGGKVYVTNSPSFLRAFDRICDMCEMTGATLNKITVEERDSKKNNRKFLTVKYVK